MEKEKNQQDLFGKSKNKNSNLEEDKFNLVSCPVTESYCNMVLEDINKLYAESEIARINKEYLRSVALLEEAYDLTDVLNNKSCLLCAAFFQHTINKTFETMKEELYEISHGIFGSDSYKLAYKKLCNRTI